MSDTFNSIDEVLTFAIRQEEQAEKLYLQLAERALQAHVKKAFEEFAAEERHHKEVLTKMLNDGVLRPSADRVPDLKIAEMMDEIEPSADLDYQQILVVAMQREKAAYKMYSALAQIAEDPKLRLTLETLAQEEAKHKLRFETEYDETILTEN